MSAYVELLQFLACPFTMKLGCQSCGKEGEVVGNQNTSRNTQRVVQVDLKQNRKKTGWVEERGNNYHCLP